MLLYKKLGNSLKPVKNLGFKLEKDMQKIAEEHLQEFFSLEFITTEFALNNLRIDTLAFDSDTESFVVIEYKRGSSYSVIDQGFAYLSLLLNNKAEFILEYNQKCGKQLRKDDIDWSAVRVIFVADAFTRYQQDAINFKDLPIELWEMKQFSDDMIILNPIRATNTAESVKTITKGDNKFTQIEKEIQTFNEDYHIEGKSQKVLELYEKIKVSILDLDPNFEVVYRKMYITFRINKKNIVSVHLFVNSINIWLYGKYGSIRDEYGLIRDVSKVGNYGNAENEIKLDSDENLLKILDLIQQTYRQQI